LLQRALADEVSTEVPPFANYSLRPRDNGSAFHWLYRGGCAAIRTRDAGRLLAGLEQHLSGHGEVEEGMLPTTLTAIITATGRAIVLPSLAEDVARFDRPLRAAGGRLLDAPRTIIDPAAGTVVVPSPSVQLEVTARAELAAHLGSGADEGCVDPGTYPLAAWILPHDGAAAPSLLAAHLLESLTPAHRARPLPLDAIGALARSTRIVPLQSYAAQDLARVVAEVG
jgi:hypothetical protein